MYATFGCKTYRNQCELLRQHGIEVEDPLGDDCEAGFVDLLPPFDEDLPICPGCGGQTEVVDLVERVAG